MECKQWHFKGQSYEGTFLDNAFHGHGTYKWNTSKVYEGSFYSNLKEGYALLSLSDNSHFEGLFVNNQPFGPGIFTYSNGRQDAGFWLGEKLVRLSRPVSYIIPRLVSTLQGKIKLYRFKRFVPLEEEVENSSSAGNFENCDCGNYSFPSPYSKLIRDKRSVFFDKSFFQNNLSKDCTDVSNLKNPRGEFGDACECDSYASNYRPNSSIAHNICNADLLFMNFKYDDACGDNISLPESKIGILTYYTKYGTLDGLENEIFDLGFEDFACDSECTVARLRVSDEAELSPQIVSWNNGELCTEMVKQIYRHRGSEDKLNFKIADLMSGVRTAFRKTGEKERKCLYFLKMCSLGPSRIVNDLLCDGEISAELMDARGNNGLMFAAAGDQIDTIEVLSDYGVDVNAFNDENLTPLNLCLLRRLALANDIFNWEVAFLPPDPPNENVDDDVGLKEIKSIESLDRIFGDGMSVCDGYCPAPTIVEEAFAIARPVSQERIPSYRKSGDGSCSSQITILNFKTLMEDFEKNKTESYEDANFFDSSLMPGSKNPTLDLRRKKVPKSYKRIEYEKSVASGSNDKYLFDLRLKEVLPIVEKPKKASAKESKVKKAPAEIPVEEKIDENIISKLNKIDETILKLLTRGANPNVSEFPKPSIHLGIFTRELRVVDFLLRYGANPNHLLGESDGSLTPLHVLVLLQPRPEYPEICQKLINFGANLEIETHPDFCVTDDEKQFLSSSQGRTPLQLLSMRPDIEYGDPAGHSLTLAVFLAKLSDKKHSYKGHSGLTLAMLSGNVRLLEAFLIHRCYNPNEILGEGLGTPLHVLTSTTLQRKVIYETSIKMADLLLAAGADPLLTLTTPQITIEDCVTYGYREIEEEKILRKGSGQKGKGQVKTEKGARDHLKDHVKVLEYLSKKQHEKHTKIEQGALSADLLPSKPKVGKSGTDGKTSTGKSEMAPPADVLAKKVTITDGEVAESGKPIKKKPPDLTSSSSKQKSESEIGAEGREGEGKGKTHGANKRDKKLRKKSARLSLSMEPKKESSADGEKASNMATGSGSLGSLEAQTMRASKCQDYSKLLFESLLKLFGDCSGKFDFNKFALPYVVLRNGNFFYKFHGPRPSRREQYSLV